MTKRNDTDGPVNATTRTTSGSGKTSPYNPNNGHGAVDWASVEGDSVLDAIDAITRNGDAILLSRSMDGGVLVATVCAGTERIKFYGRSSEEMTAHLQGIKSQLDIRSGR